MEAHIVINGTILDEAQSMTVRVAVSSMRMELSATLSSAPNSALSQKDTKNDCQSLKRYFFPAKDDYLHHLTKGTLSSDEVFLFYINTNLPISFSNSPHLKVLNSSTRESNYRILTNSLETLSYLHWCF